MLSLKFSKCVKSVKGVKITICDIDIKKLQKSIVMSHYYFKNLKNQEICAKIKKKPYQI